MKKVDESIENWSMYLNYFEKFCNSDKDPDFDASIQLHPLMVYAQKQQERARKNAEKAQNENPDVPHIYSEFDIILIIYKIGCLNNALKYVFIIRKYEKTSLPRTPWVAVSN